MMAARTLVGCLVLVAVAALAAPAAAQTPGHGPGGPPATAHDAPRPADAGPATSGGHVLVAALRFASDGTLVIDGGRIVAPQPWPRFLAAGMWLRVEGDWDGALFRATSLAVTRPALFSYYRGPAAPLDLGEGWVEAWFAATGPGQGTGLFDLRRVPPDAQTQALVRASNGRWLALPPGLRPPPPPAGDGWVLVRGHVEGEVVHWIASEPFR